MADSPRIEDLRRRVQKDPASIAFAQLAEELRRAHQFDEAIETCRAGLAIHPGYLSARVTLGRSLLETNALEEARAELETVLKNAPENLAAIRGLAEILHRQGSLPEALAQYRAALTLAKNDPDLQQTVAELAKIVEPQKPPHVGQGLSLEDMRNELFAMSPPAASPQATPSDPPSAGSAQPSAESAPQTTESDRSAGTAEPSTGSVDQGIGSAAQQSGFAPAPGPVQNSIGTVDEPGTAADPSSTVEHQPSAPTDFPATPSEPPVLQSEAQPDTERAQQTIVALEQWLDAIHVARTQPRS